MVGEFNTAIATYKGSLKKFFSAIALLLPGDRAVLLKADRTLEKIVDAEIERDEAVKLIQDSRVMSKE